MDRFWIKAAVGTPHECWEWKACLLGGYGRFRWRGASMLANRVAWELTNGPIPQGMFVCHRCDNPRCVNPNHLFLGTPKQNFDDMVEKRREKIREARKRGHLSHAAKLSLNQMLAIKADTRSQRAIARHYGVGKTTVFHIKNGNTLIRP
jgi:hypothetical protein